MRSSTFLFSMLYGWSSLCFQVMSISTQIVTLLVQPCVSQDLIGLEGEDLARFLPSIAEKYVSYLLFFTVLPSLQDFDITLEVGNQMLHYA